MRKGYLAGGILFAVLAVLSLPSLTTWDGRKAELAEALQKRLGRPVALDGRLRLSLLPLPHAVVEDVRLANTEGAADPDMLEARRLEMRPAFWPLLTGRVELASVRLSGVALHLQRLPGGRGNWQFGAEAKPVEDAPAVPAEPAAPRESSLPALDLEDAVVTYQAGDGSPLRLTVRSAKVSRSGGGAVFTVKAEAEGVPFDLQGHLSPDGQAAFDLALDHQAAQAAFVGRFTTEAGFAGTLDVKAPKLGDLAAAFGWTTARLPQGGAEIRGDLTLDGRRMHLAQGAVGLAGAEGTVSLDADFGHVPQIEAALAFGRLDLDQWMASLPPPVSVLEQAAAAPPPPEQTQPSPAGGTGGFSKALSVVLDVTADSLTLRGGALRRARLNAVLDNGELLVNQAGVELPGDGELDLFGFFTPGNGGIAFDGTLEGRSDDLRTTLAWLGVSSGHPAEDRLRKGGFTGRFLADARTLRLEAGVLKLDGAKADLAADLSLGPRPALGISFSVDTLDLDAYRVKSPEMAGQPAAAPVKTEGAAQPPPDPAWGGWLSGIDANVKGRVGTLTAYGLTARDLALDVNWLNGVLTLHEVTSPDLDGASLLLTGGLVPDETAFRRFQWEIRSDHPGPLLRDLAGRLPVDPDRLGPLVLTGGLDGKLSDQLTLDSRNQIAGGWLEVSGRIEHALDHPGLHLSLAASHASMAQLLRQVSPDYRPRDDLGGFAASMKIEGSPEDQAALRDLRLKLGPAAAAGEGRVSLAGPRPRLDVRLTAGDLAVDPFLPARRISDAGPIPYRRRSGQSLLIPARWPGDNEQPPPPASAPRPQVAVGEAANHWSVSPLPLEVLTRLDGSLILEAPAVVWGGTRLESASLALDLEDGSARLDHLKGGLWGGEMELSGALADNGTARLEAKLAHARMKQVLLSTSGLGVADGMLDAETALTAKGGSAAELVSHLDGDVRIEGRDGTVNGFDLKAVDDKAKEMSSPLGLIGLIQAGLSGGSTGFSSLTGTAKVKDGIVTCDDLTLVADGGGGKGEANVNLPDWVMDSRIAFSLASSPDAPPLVMRLSGPLDNPRRFLDINAMQTWLAHKGVSLKGRLKDAGDALGRMMSGQRKDDGGKVKAKDVVKSLLKGLP